MDKKCLFSAILTTTLISQIKQLHQPLSSICIQMRTYKYIILNLVVHWATNAKNLVALSQNLRKKIILNKSFWLVKAQQLILKWLLSPPGYQTMGNCKLDFGCPVGFPGCPWLSEHQNLPSLMQDLCLSLWYIPLLSLVPNPTARDIVILARIEKDISVKHIFSLALMTSCSIWQCRVYY